MILKSGGGRMLRWASDAFSSSALATIVRNLYIPKRTPCRPVRCWRNRTGPRESRRTAMAQPMRIGASSGIARMQIARSIARLMRENLR
jgi:hypothetical protein